ncbi:hypothetical protein F4859DRAFT_512446 [Xylaria cf. heliscus]|nr:hypothetical protein F4859DRAFT_512446 [Xylaria cf. heliscus]
MYNCNTLVFLVAFAGASVSMAQEFPDPACGQLAEELIGAAPTAPAGLSSYFSAQQTEAPTPGDLLRDPPAYVEQLCGLAISAPQSVLVEFQGWGSSLLNYVSTEISLYDEVVTKCITTGTAAASITSYIHEIAESPGQLCQPTGTLTGGSGTASVTPSPTVIGNGTNPGTVGPNTSIPVAAATRPTGVLAGAAAMGAVGAAALL